MNKNYMLGVNGNNINFFFSLPNLSIIIKPIDCPNNTNINEIEICEVYSFIDIRNTVTRWYV